MGAKTNKKTEQGWGEERGERSVRALCLRAPPAFSERKRLLYGGYILLIPGIKGLHYVRHINFLTFTDLYLSISRQSFRLKLTWISNLKVLFLAGSMVYLSKPECFGCQSGFKETKSVNGTNAARMFEKHIQR